MNTLAMFTARGEMKKVLDLQGLSWVGGRNRTRTCDPIDVNDVLYQLSHATLLVHTAFESLYQPVLPTEPCDHRYPEWIYQPEQIKV